MSNLQRQLNNIANKKVYQIKKMFEVECKRLEKLILDEIVNYYNSYTPTVYERTYEWLNSVRVTAVHESNNTLSARIYFTDRQAYHRSIIYPNDDSQMGYVPLLMEYGWLWSNPSIYKFHYYDGYAPVHRAIARFKTQTKLPIDVNIMVNGKNESYF